MLRRRLRDAALLLLGILLLGSAVSMLVDFRPRRLATLKLTAGDVNGLRHRLAVDFADEARSQGLQIKIQPTDGSEAALLAVDRGEFDLALVQGGLRGKNLDNVRQVTALHVEPLHLLVKPELFAAIEQRGLAALEGATINVGSSGSGTQALSKEVLDFVGLVNSTDDSLYRPNELAYEQLLSVSAELLPDAIFTVSSLPSPVATHLIRAHRFRLVPLNFGEALSLQALVELGAPEGYGDIDKRLIYKTQIPSYTYSVQRAEPPETLTTFGTRMLLVAHESVDPAVVARLLDALFESDFAQAERPPLDTSLLDLPPELPMHAGAIYYRQRNKPVIAGDLVDYVEKLLAIAATLLGGTFFLAQWYFRMLRRRRESNLAHYIVRVTQIEKEALDNEVAAQLNLAALIRLQNELAKIKAEAVQRFASGELEGESLIQGFLSLVNDARNQLTRLILHQRENIEEESQALHASSDELWRAQSKEV
jgi:TRAP-type uncharacterized transport system substrate-binding protein